MKKKIAIILTVFLVLSIAFWGMLSSHKKVYAKNAQMVLSMEETIQKENEFKVKILLDSDVDLYSVDAYLSYPADLLEFVPTDNLITGTDGVLELKDIYGEETKRAEYEITFKALETGMAEVALTNVYLIDYEDLDYITVMPSAKQFRIEVNDEICEDARLADLVIAPGYFTEEFRPNKYRYEFFVEAGVNELGVSAIPMKEDSVVELDMPEKLQDGDNMIVIKVTAISGNTATYKIKAITGKE